MLQIQKILAFISRTITIGFKIAAGLLKHCYKTGILYSLCRDYKLKIKC